MERNHPFRRQLRLTLAGGGVFLFFMVVLVFHSIRQEQLFSSRVAVCIRQKALALEIAEKLRDASESPGDTLSGDERDALTMLSVKLENSERALVNGGELYGISGENSEEIQALLLKASAPFVQIQDQVTAAIEGGTGSSDFSLQASRESVHEFADRMDDATGEFMNESRESDDLVRLMALLILATALAYYIVIFRRVLVRGVDGILQAAEEVRSMKKDLDAANQVKTEFMANMSHEIRTPLNGVIGMAEILSKTRLDEEQRECVRSIHSSAINLLDIVNDVLDYAQIEAGKLEIVKERFVLSDCIDQVTDLLKPLARQKKLELMSEIDPEIPKELVQDERRLRQVLLNLLNNAVKFTEYGEIVLRVELVNRESGFVQLKFSVRDTGIGMPESRLPFLFQSFSQADTGISRKYGGSGLGLAICKSLVMAMGGKIWAESTEGKGSTFYFTMVSEASGESQSARIKHLNGLKAVVVDDNKTNLKILVKQLSAWGIQATPFNSPDIVAEIIPNLKKFDFCILDMQMPEIDGGMLAERIREMHSMSDLPIIVMSSVGEHLVDQRRNLYNIYLTKPVKQSRLLDAIAEVMKISGAEGSGGRGKYEGEFGMHKLNVLIAHDNELTQAVTERTLELMGCSYHIAHSGKEVLAESRESDFDLIIMDVDLPGMNALETVKRLKRRAGESDMPVIIGITSNEESDKKVCLQAGMDDLLERPMNPDDLQRKIHHWFE